MIIASYENALLCQQKFIELQMTTLADAFSICLGKPQELFSRRRWTTVWAKMVGR